MLITLQNLKIKGFASTAKMATAAIAITLGLALAPTVQAAGETIKIGVSGPFTGGSSSMGTSMRDGILLATGEINKAGGVLGKQIELVIRDDEAKNEVGVQVTQELINKEKVVATVGYVNTGVALASQRFYQEAEIPVITAVATGTKVTRQFDDQPNNYVFRTSANDTIQSSMIAYQAVNVLRAKKPAIMADSTNYGQLGQADLTAALAKLNITPVANEKFNVGDTDMTSQILRAKEAGADVILTYAIGPELAQVANAMAKLGWKVPIVGSWTLAMASFIDTAGVNGHGAMMPQTFIQFNSTPKRKAFIEAYQKAYKTDRFPSAVAAAQGYDAIYILTAAIKQAGTTEGKKIREALESLNTKIEGVVTTYDRPFSATDHETITYNIPVFGIVKGDRVVPYNPNDFTSKNAVRLKPKS